MNKAGYDIAIIGGGLAGLTLAIKLSQAGHSVILFEKNVYPFHKVCGEYISMESWPYLEGLGLDLNNLHLPMIRQLQLSAPSGNMLNIALQPGGFGISRHMIDSRLKDIAVNNGVTLLEKCKAENVQFDKDIFTIHTSKGVYTSRVCCGSFGKRSNLDIKWNRRFINETKNSLNNYIGVKYHVITDRSPGIISLHNFKNGYCGISEIEENKYCLCYLTTAANLKKYGSIEDMERSLLSKNRHLKSIFENCKKLYTQPLSVSQISFQKKTLVEDHVIMTGDAAGMITPLCGNGMSMAMHAGKLAAKYISAFLNNTISREEMEDLYIKDWERNFAKRLRTGRMIQRFFGKSWLSNLFIGTLKRFPGISGKIIRMTHGDPF